MDLLIPDNWIREFLKTKATPKQIAKYLSLCGPSVERINTTTYGPVYSIEVTTNRVDSASIYGIAREAAAILPRFKIRASLQSIKVAAFKFSKNVDYLEVEVNNKLCPRFSAVLIKNVKISHSPSWIKERLLAVAVRPINNIVDISNFIMHELGQPVHTFDYDKIKGRKMILRESFEGERIRTLDGKTHKLFGGDIVIEDGSGKLIDLAGIMGAENSAIDANTKNVLLFVQTYNPLNIRRTSMSLAHRTEAAVLFEKGLDPELVRVGVLRGIELMEKLTGGKSENEILDLYPNPYKGSTLAIDIGFINERLGIELSSSEVSKILTALGFEVSWKELKLEVSIPSFRVGDIRIPEDIVEEVARIYGYHNLPSKLMTGAIPEPLANAPFNFEAKLKNIIKGYGGVEVYTLSLVSKKDAEQNALKLKNPLGLDSEYLKTSLRPSLIKAANENSGEKDPFHLFEMANIYIPRKGNLPEEKMILGGIFSNYSFREAKGVIETLLEELNISANYTSQDSKDFSASQRLTVKTGTKNLGEFGVLENGLMKLFQNSHGGIWYTTWCIPLSPHVVSQFTKPTLSKPSQTRRGSFETGFIYYEFEVETLRKEAKDFSQYRPLPKYPPQIEDMTFSFPERTKIGEVADFVRGNIQHLMQFELADIYEDSYTFRILYQHPTKTLTDREVASIREKIVKGVERKFGGIQKA